MKLKSKGTQNGETLKKGFPYLSTLNFNRHPFEKFAHIMKYL